MSLGEDKGKAMLYPHSRFWPKFRRTSMEVKLVQLTKRYIFEAKRPLIIVCQF
jgi:hypothetical protein